MTTRVDERGGKEKEEGRREARAARQAGGQGAREGQSGGRERGGERERERRERGEGREGGSARARERRRESAARRVWSSRGEGSRGAWEGQGEKKSVKRTLLFTKRSLTCRLVGHASCHDSRSARHAGRSCHDPLSTGAGGSAGPPCLAERDAHAGRGLKGNAA